VVEGDLVDQWAQHPDTHTSENVITAATLLISTPLVGTGLETSEKEKQELLQKHPTWPVMTTTTMVITAIIRPLNRLSEMTPSGTPIQALLAT
jgi:hypothetical protein